MPAERAVFLNRHCPNASQQIQYDNDRLKYFLIDDKHKILYCYVAKVGCSTMKRIMLILSNANYTKDPLAIDSLFIHRIVQKSFINMSKEEIAYRLENYHKVMVVRNPIQRLWSAYLDKVYLVQFVNIVKRIVESYRENPTERERACANDATFSEFLKFTADNPEFNEHWMPYNQVCQPCAIKYNAVFKLESFDKDLEYFLRKTNTSNEVDLSNLKNQTSTKSDVVEKVIKRSMGRDLYTLRQRTYKEDGKPKECINSSVLANRVWKSFILRGYVPPDTPYPSVLQNGKRVYPYTFLLMFQNMVQGIPIPGTNKTIQSAHDVIKEGFKGLSEKYIRLWLENYRNDFKWFDYELPSYLRDILSLSK